MKSTEFANGGAEVLLRCTEVANEGTGVATEGPGVILRKTEGSYSIVFYQFEF